jgi:molybdate transport system ATP-binding protein
MLDVSVKVSLGSFQLAIEQQFSDTGVTAIFGPSGCGKSTLLKTIAGVLNKAKGHVTWRGQIWLNDSKTLKPEHRRLALVFQKAHLFETQTVRQNLLYGFPKNRKAAISEQDVVTMLSLQDLLDRMPSQLSGGQQQRVALGRALLSQPELLLLDEPMNGLDNKAKRDIMRYLKQIQQRFNLPIIVVTHHVDEVVQLADNVALMEQGKVVSSGTLQEQVAELSGHSEGPLSVLDVSESLADANPAQAMSTWTLGEQSIVLPKVGEMSESQRRLLVWARDVSVATHFIDSTSLTNQVKAQVQGFENAEHSAEVIVLLEVAGQKLRALITKASAERLGLQPGQWVYASFKAAAMH